jgi:hypothetical protein
VFDPKDDLIEYYTNSVDTDEMKDVTEKSIRSALFDDDEDDDEDEDEDGAQLDEEELMNLLRERRNNKLH